MSKKRVIKTKKTSELDPKAKGSGTRIKRAVRTDRSDQSTTLVFGKENYKWIGIGLVLIFLGMFLMLGGYNDNPAVWDESQIYGFQRTLLAPVVILAGLVVEMYAIFR